MARNKTREEKIRTSYRLHDFRLASEARTLVKDAQDFEYLDAKYVTKDLLKTLVVSVFMVLLIFAAQRYLG